MRDICLVLNQRRDLITNTPITVDDFCVGYLSSGRGRIFLHVRLTCNVIANFLRYSTLPI